jgi:hypothetical protein
MSANGSFSASLIFSVPKDCEREEFVETPNFSEDESFFQEQGIEVENSTKKLHRLDETNQINTQKETSQYLPETVSERVVETKASQNHISYDKPQTSKKNYNFPEEIDLKEILTTNNDTIIMPHDESQSSTQYVLQSVIVHAGPFGSGHYYSYCKPMLTLEEKGEEITYTSSTSKTNKNTKRCQWYRFDDEIVTPVTFEEVLADAYGGISSTATGWNEKHLRNIARRNRLFQWLTSTAISCNSTKYTYGYGGRDSCAYVLQYVRKRDIPFLYKGNRME